MAGTFRRRPATAASLPELRPAGIHEIRYPRPPRNLFSQSPDSFRDRGACVVGGGVEDRGGLVVGFELDPDVVYGYRKPETTL